METTNGPQGVQVTNDSPRRRWSHLGRLVARRLRDNSQTEPDTTREEGYRLALDLVGKAKSMITASAGRTASSTRRNGEPEPNYRCAGYKAFFTHIDQPMRLMVVVRTFLSWSLVVEIEGHWPWKTPSTNPLGRRP
jgi:hypothetical protein